MAETRSWDIDWKPERLSASFHGRDLFAPVAAKLACGEPPPGRTREAGADRRTNWPDDLSEIVYVDHFGNAMTGLRAAMLSPNASSLRQGRCWSAPGPSATGRRVQPSGTRMRTGLPKSLSIEGARTAGLVFRSAVRLRSPHEWRRGPLQPWSAAMRKRIKQNLASHGLKPQKRRGKSLATGNKHLAEQIRKILRKHYANKYGVR